MYQQNYSSYVNLSKNDKEHQFLKINCTSDMSFLCFMIHYSLSAFDISLFACSLLSAFTIRLIYSNMGTLREINKGKLTAAQSSHSIRRVMQMSHLWDLQQVWSWSFYRNILYYCGCEFLRSFCLLNCMLYTI